MQRNREFVENGLAQFALESPPNCAAGLLESSGGNAVLQEIWDGYPHAQQAEPFDPRATVRLIIARPAPDPAAPRLIPFDSERHRGALIQLQGVARVGDTHLAFLSFAGERVRYFCLERVKYGGEGNGTLLVERRMEEGAPTRTVLCEGPQPTAEGMIAALEDLLCGGRR